MAVAILILVLFVVGAAAMITRTLPALIVLPLLGVAIAAGAALFEPSISARDVFDGVLSQGAIRLHEAMVIALFGGMLSFLMQRSGVAESLVKHGAELFGENPLAVCVLSMLLTALLFTSVGGLGAVIMIAMIVLPVLSTVGIEAPIAGGVLLFGMSLGGAINPSNWALYIQALHVDVAVVQRFALVVFALTLIAGVAFLAIELWRTNAVRDVRSTLAWGLGTIVVAGLGAWLFAGGEGEAEPAWRRPAQIALALALALVFVFMVLDFARRMRRWRQSTVSIRWWAYLIPLVPLVMIVVFRLPILAAFAIGLVYAVLATLRPGSVQMTMQSLIEGGASSIPAVLLMLGIGILIAAVQGPANWSETHANAVWPVRAALEPILSTLIPKTALAYVLGFGLAAPLALYRGPLNVWGLGFGVATILAAAGSLPAAAIMAMLFAVGQVQGICDPTNTANVWLANELRVDVQTLMLRTLPYVWALAFVGLVAGAIFYL